MAYYVYLLTNKTNTVLYTGVTNNLLKRVFEHRKEYVDGFTKRYNLKKLVYYESHQDINTAIRREKEIKGWVRKKKNVLISEKNASWIDLYPSIV